jgi:dTDP-4-dehydrorhamnose 3,5-epimerase
VPVETTAIEGLLVVRWPTHADDRGFFRQTWQRPELAQALGHEPVFRQGNHSRSVPGVLRGFHAEPWNKLIQVVRGRALCAFLDIRPDQPTFGQAVTMHLGDPGGPHDAQQVSIWVPSGVANGFCVYGDEPADYVYAVTATWEPGNYPAVAWNDPDASVDWPVDHPILSDADRSHPRLRDLFPDHPRWSSR